jgi:drug/metabolite transporter, DME family
VPPRAEPGLRRSTGQALYHAPVSTTAVRTTQTSLPLAGFLICAGAAALFGTLGVLSRSAYAQGMEPTAFVAWRSLTGFLFLAVVVGWRIRRGMTPTVSWRSIPNRSRAALLAASLAGTVLNICMFIAFDRITIALALLGFYTYPAIVAVANVALGRERLDGSRALALALAIAGMIAVVASQLDPAGGIRLDAVGVGLALGAAVCQSIFVLLAREGYPEVPNEQAMTTILLVSGIGSLLVALIAGGIPALVLPFQVPSLLPLLAFTGIAACAIPSLGFLTGIRLIGGTRAGIVMLLEPVVGVTLAAWLLGEALVPIQLLGAAAILGAAILLRREGHPADGEPDDDDRAVLVPGGP